MADKQGAYLSADDFLAAIAGGLIDHELTVDGKVVGKVQIRSLGLEEVQSAVTRLRDRSGELMLWALDNALVTPELTDAQRETVRKGKPGPLMALAQHIMQTSGMVDTEDGGSPLAGDTSSPAAVEQT